MDVGLITERTMRGKAKRARSGKIPQATGQGIYGYRYNQETGQRVIDNAQSLIVRRIFERFCSGDTCNRIAVDFNSDAIPAFSGKRWHPLPLGACY